MVAEEEGETAYRACWLPFESLVSGAALPSLAGFEGRSGEARRLHPSQVGGEGGGGVGVGGDGGRGRGEPGDRLD